MLLTCAVVLLSLLLVPDIRRPDSRLLAAAEDLLHFPLFLAVTLLVLRSGVALRAAGPRNVRVVAALALTAACVEIVQPVLGRTGQWTDALIGVLGVLAAWALRASVGGGRRTVCLGAAFLCAVAACAPAAGVALDRARARREFPVLASFEHALELGRWEAAGCTLRRVASGEGRSGRSLEVLVSGDEPYPGIFLKEMPAGWAGYSRVCCRVDSTSEGGVVLWLRADDRQSAPYSDRFQQAFRLKPGLQRLCVDLADLCTPEGRRLDLGHIRTLGFFLEDARAGDILSLDDVVLEGP